MNEARPIAIALKIRATISKATLGEGAAHTKLSTKMTFAWMNWVKRLSKDFELNPKSSETMIHIANVHRLLRKAI